MTDKSLSPVTENTAAHSKNGIASTVVISVFTLINLILFFGALIHMDPSAWGGTVPPTEELGEMSILVVAIYGAVLVFLWGWMLAISITHTVCLIFSIRNRKSPLKSIRILSYVLDVLNAVLIVTPILKIWVF